ncbi:hypothetical protein J3R30DRAFT_3756131 [Lentinula aciculospora]|uniref:Uncharacterized protein n=1 Tax=Lentinula aciculospora TaxID=153920 RepID=A0A9W9AA92_9AGAR|nr:hypothetical protein J3R30DRAFT_3756131 [Lentinula aciculospora]
MFIKYLLACLVLSLTFMIVQAARLNDARPSGIRKKPPTPQKSRIARVKPSNDPSRGQPLYIVLECNIAPQDNQDSEKAREQISQFLSSQEIWDKLNLDKYRKRNSLEGSRVEALIIQIYKYPHPVNVRTTLHFSIAGPEKCDGEPYGCKAAFLRESPVKNFLITNHRSGEVKAIIAEQPDGFATAPPAGGTLLA